ncbi:trace amine-associated receptor 6-like [Copidosoma floridanum]|uniref:trace amine-associated receptor 6-like n=1 Tax=Copidosoma floridanum TaxID=29053 RepID=UPI000C6F8750|nr:trace amine-associated receptor 6-like [Copidosoma floridanum]
MYELVCIILLVVTIIFGNGLTIIAGRLSHKLLSVTSNQLILSLAISDFFVGFALFYDLIFLIEQSLNYYKFLCLLRYVIVCGACMTSFFNILAVAINRYVAIAYPLKYPKYLTRKKTNAMIGINWCAALIISTIPFYWNEYQSTQECISINFIPRCDSSTDIFYYLAEYSRLILENLESNEVTWLQMQ